MKLKNLELEMRNRESEERTKMVLEELQKSNKEENKKQNEDVLGFFRALQEDFENYMKTHP